MSYIDPDAADPRLVQELTSYYEDSATRLRTAILNPMGKNPTSQALNQARASQLAAEVNQEIQRLKGHAGDWTGKAISAALNKGLVKGQQQLAEMGLRTKNQELTTQGSLSLIDHRAVQVLARDTYSDLAKSADAMGRNAGLALRRMSATGVTNAEVNRILAGGIIEGKPVQAIRELRTALEKVHGGEVEIPMKNGGTRTYDTSYYAELVARSKMREATVTGRHERLGAAGIDLVSIIGRISKNPCTRLLGRVYSLSGADKKYPAFSTVSEGQEPYRLFHPNCSKSTAPFVAGLSSLPAPPQPRSEAA